MLRKLQITFLMLFSSVVIVIGGYNCSQKIIYPDSGSIPIGDDYYNNNYGRNDYNDRRDDSNDRRDDYDEDNLLPEEPNDNYCNRSIYEDLEDEYGTSAFIRFDSGGLRDFRMGLGTNFDLNCKRIYLSMTKKGRKRSYKGDLTLSYEENNEIKQESFKSGNNESENRYNKWVDRDRDPAKTTGRLDSKFYAIFENPVAALILVIDKVHQRGARDGETKLVGSGELWYKMFRTFKSLSDVCHTEGTYVSRARKTPSKPGKRCWLLSFGPYSCRPQGIYSRDFDLKDEEYDCYDKLGDFGNLDVRKAFNIRSGYPY